MIMSLRNSLLLVMKIQKTLFTVLTKSPNSLMVVVITAASHALKLMTDVVLPVDHSTILRLAVLLISMVMRKNVMTVTMVISLLP